MLPTQVQAGLRPPGGCGCGVSGHGWWLAAWAAGWSRCPRSVCGPFLEGRLGSPQGLIKMSGREGSKGSSVSHPTAPGTTGLPLPHDDPQTWQQHEDARPHPYLARRFCGPCRGLQRRCVIRRGQGHLPKETGSAGPAPHTSPRPAPSCHQHPPAQEPGLRPSRVATQSHPPTSPARASLLRSRQGTLRSSQLKRKQTTRIRLSFLPGNCNSSRCWTAGRTLGP